MQNSSFYTRRFLTGLLFLVVGWSASLRASHNLAGEITFNYISGNTVEIVLTTYTDPSDNNVDRCQADLEIWNAAGTTKIADIPSIPRSNGPFGTDPRFPISCVGNNAANMGEYILGNAKKNIYSTTYTFTGPGNYLIRYYDVARLNNIDNMINSGQQAFFVETTLLLAPILGEQNSVRFLNHPLDRACTGKLWTHNPGGYDPDGDSLRFELVPCRQYDPPAVPAPINCSGFLPPDQANGNQGGLSMDPSTGLITWNTPDVVGIYNLAYKVDEYRNGILMGTVYRDMAIYVEPCENDPPVIQTITDTCITSGDTLRFEATFFDPNFFTSVNPPGDSIYVYLNNNLGGNNGPFSVAVSPASIDFIPPGLPPGTFPVESNDTVRAYFEWATTCDHVRPAFYQVDFYVHDNLSYFDNPPDGMLSANHIVKIYVKPEALTGLTAVAANREVTLNWDPHPCDSAVTYEIWRKTGAAGFANDSICCSANPARQGFRLIGINDGHLNTTYVDGNNGAEFPYGEQICYLVRAVFTNGVKSCPTEEVCVEIEKDFAVLTKDSIDVTGASGRISVNWSQPSDIDAIFPTPYTYTVMRADGITGPALYNPVATGIPFNDTTFVDTGMDTEVRGYRYRIDTYDANGDLIADGNTGSSIFLSITPRNRALSLSWEEHVPWLNRIYYIYRAPDATSPLTLIDSVNGSGAVVHSYLDTGLENFEDYCYVVVSEGEYGTPDVVDSVRNASQRVCGIPEDFEPPCISTINFDTARNCTTLSITLFWNEPDSICGSDVDFYTIYLADNRDADFQPIATVDSGNYSYLLYNLETIADCYGITATDTNGNESEMVVYCFENCPEISLPNVITPNGDGVNDYFSPITDRAVHVTEAVFYDRWGRAVFSTNNVTDPLRIWDGRTNDGQEVPEGVYYYVIRYEEDRLPDMVPKVPLIGNVTLLR